MQVLCEGTQLADRYVLLRRLGEGGMSELWLARDERADTTVALKFLKPKLAAQAAYRHLFYNEWRTGSRLMHAHIARVFEYHDDAASPYYALQYIDGPEIGVLANEALPDSLKPFGLLADALRYAHGKELVHRDIKASNVLLDQRGAPYLLDFGVAAAAGSESAGGGSPVNASPTQRAGEAPRPADDVYALGVLMHEIITGRPPQDGAPSSTLTRPTGEAVPDAVQRLVRDMLSNEASRPTAEQVRDRLAAAGIAAAPVKLPARYLTAAAEAAPAEVTVRSVRPERRQPLAPGAPAPAGTASRRGISAPVVYGGLAVLLLIFIGVIVVLPKAVDRDDAVSGGAASGEEAPASPVADDPAGTAVGVEPGAGIDGGSTGFSENLGRTSADEELRIKIATDEALGDLLSQLERLKYRGIERWGGQRYLDALDVYAAGDEAYLNKNYRTAGERYREAAAMLEPFFDRIDAEFRKAMDAARQAFENRDYVEAIRLFDLAVAISPGNPAAERGLKRALNLEAVLDLMDQGRQFRAELELDAAKLAFEKALELDADWEPAREALQTVRAQIKQRSFEMRMTEGFNALASGDFDSARAAFNAAKLIDPQSREPSDGLLQVDQEVRLFRIREMEQEALAEEQSEQWEAAVSTYEALLEVDGDLEFAKEGLSRANARAAVHRSIQGYVDDPDGLSDPATMQRATQLLLDVSRMDPMGPRLTDHKEELSRLLKRAATPLTVKLVSDNATEVSVYRVGKLGSFATRELSLRPGSYVAIGIRPGYRDVRREFRVAPEIEQQPIVVQCEEPI